MAKQVTLSIDGVQVSVPEGTLIVNAAKQIGIDIPVFCFHPKMEPVGMCRQCLVEVGRPVIDRATGQPVMEGGQPNIQFGPKLETACSTPVSAGMQVMSQSEKASAAQKEILEFLLTSHPLDCPVCDKGGECPLQNLTMAHASPQSRFIYAEKNHAAKHVPLGDLIWLDRERCIQCARCIRFQDEIAGDSVLGFYQRGRATDIFTNSEPGFDFGLFRQHQRHLPGRRADHFGLPLWGTPLGVESGSLAVCTLPGGLQHYLQYPPRGYGGRQDRHQAGHAAPE